MTDPQKQSVEQLLAESSAHFGQWEKIKDVIDQLIDLMLNLRQSGHPGGSRSKVHPLVATLLSGAMRWDIRRPEHRFGDRFILVAGHTAPLVYATLCLFGEAMRTRYQQTGDKRFFIPDNRIVLASDLVQFRRRKGLPGHAEMSGKTLFFKANTGPSGHGSPIAAGEALALKHAGAESVKVFAFEGEGGLTAGASHETKNSAWGLGLSNLIYVVDWNNFGIDNQPINSVVYGTPELWFKNHGWRTFGTEQLEHWPSITEAILQAARSDNENSVPSMVWIKSRKGRGYYVYDNTSHGKPHGPNSDLFWHCRQDFSAKYGVAWVGVGAGKPDPATLIKQTEANIEVALSAALKDQACLEYLTDRLVALGEQVPETLQTYRLTTKTNPFADPELTDPARYPQSLWAKPGDHLPNRAGLGKWGAYINTWAKKKYGRPLFLACSADLADSTNIAGFAQDFDGAPGWGVYDRNHNPSGALLPQEITEFANAGISCGVATVNLSETPFEDWNGYMAACSTYGSFVYLKYGLMRLFSQTAQDSDIKVGKVLWVAGHSGPETADDSRTHFGIFAPGVTQLFPHNAVIDVHPWEYNEVPVVIAAGLRTSAPIIALHLTRPPVKIPDRQGLGIPSHYEAAKGAYILRPYRQDRPRHGCVFVQGTSSTDHVVRLLPELERLGLNVKIVAAISPQLFALQTRAYREMVITEADRLDSTFISNRCKRLASDWSLNPLAEEYSITSDWDDRWRTGGTLEEVLEEAHLTPEWILRGLERFVKERDTRLKTLRRWLESAESGGR